MKVLIPVSATMIINIGLTIFAETIACPNINVPTLLVWGSLDKETPFYFTKIFKKNIKDCEVIEFKNCSHFAYLEKPDLFLKILLSYFN